MDNNLTTNSISIVLDKMDSKFLELYSQKACNDDNFNNEEPLSIDSNPNTFLTNDLTALDLNNIDFELQIKPFHWKEENWQQTLKNYKWISHKNNYIECKICNNLEKWKLFLMDLSFSDFEIKLADHDACIQHINCESAQIIQTSDLNYKYERVSPIITKNPFEDHFCPICQRSFKFKKTLARHIYNCDNQDETNAFNLSCECKDVEIKSIRKIDEHNVNMHSNSLLFVCKFCNSQFSQTTVLYRHFLISHNFNWNPYKEMPNIVIGPLRDDGKPISSRPERKKISFKEFHVDYITNEKIPVSRIYKKRHDREAKLKKETVISPKTMKNKSDETSKWEVSKLSISQSSILTCEYCGGRYFSGSIFNSHLANYHATMISPNDKPDKVSTSSNILVEKRSNRFYNQLLTHMKKIRSLQMKRKSFSMDDEMISKKIKQKAINSLLVKRNKISASMLSCPICQMTFDNLNLRHNHVSKQHPEFDKLCCKICGLIFTNQKNYRQHLEKSHNVSLPKLIKSTPEKMYSCINCHLAFTNRADLFSHISLSHPELKDQEIISDCDLYENEPFDTDETDSKSNEMRDNFHKKKNVLSLIEKVEILKALEIKEPWKVISEKYRIGRSTIGGIKKNKENIRRFMNESNLKMKSRKTLKSGKFPCVEKALFCWLIQKKCLRIPVLNKMLKEKAKFFYKEICGDDEFKASAGWCQKFKERYDVQFRELTSDKLFVTHSQILNEDIFDDEEIINFVTTDSKSEIKLNKSGENSSGSNTFPVFNKMLMEKAKFLYHQICGSAEFLSDPDWYGKFKPHNDIIQYRKLTNEKSSIYKSDINFTDEENCNFPFIPPIKNEIMFDISAEYITESNVAKTKPQTVKPKSMKINDVFYHKDALKAANVVLSYMECSNFNLNDIFSLRGLRERIVENIVELK